MKYQQALIKYDCRNVSVVTCGQILKSKKQPVFRLDINKVS